MSGKSLLTAVSGAALALPLGVAIAPAAGAATTTAARTAYATVAVYDPQDTLGWDGDTHEVSASLSDGGSASFTVYSYVCGPHDVTKTPDQLGCASAGPFGEDLQGEDARLTVSGDTFRWTATTGKGPLTLTFAGGARDTWLSREWQNTEGTRRESGRHVNDRVSGATVSGALGGLAVAQPAAWQGGAYNQLFRTSKQVTTVKAIPVPVLPPAGTAVMVTSAGWKLPLPGGLLEVGGVGASFGPETIGDTRWASAGLSVLRCDSGETPEAGTCETVERLADQVEPTYRYTASTRTGAARLTGIATVETPPWDEKPQYPVTATWRGGTAVGVHNVTYEQGEPGVQPTLTTVDGVRRIGQTARVVWDGTVKPASQVNNFSYVETHTEVPVRPV